jgi:opacity protein-like surface antigen
MMKQKFAILVFSFFCLGIPLAKAQYYDYFPPGAGPYFRLGGGPSFYFDGTLQQFGTVQNARVNYTTGFALDAGMGYAFNKYISVGFDTGFLDTWINNVNSPGFSTGNAYIDNIPFMAEATLSLPIPHTILVPYIGAAVGGSSSEFWANSFGFGNNANGFVSGSAWDTVFAYSASAGVRFNVSRHFSAAIGYNYFATGDTSYTYYGAFGSSINANFKGVQANSVMFTLRWLF